MGQLSSRLLNHTITILRPSAGPVDRLNRPTTIWKSAGQVRGEIQQVIGRQVTNQLGETLIVDWLIILPAYTDVDFRYSLKKGAVTYEVQSVDRPMVRGEEHHVEVLARTVA